MAEILITGAGGRLGSVLLGQATRAGASCLGTVSWTGPRPRAGVVQELDLRNDEQVARLLSRERPRAVLHLAAESDVARARRTPIVTHEINVEATARLSELTADCGAAFVFASTDMVFDGEDAPYGENDTPNPLSIYGRSKLLAESHVMREPDATIARLPFMFGNVEVEREPKFFASLVASLRGEAPPLTLFTDEYRTPLSYDDAAAALLTVLGSPPGGVVHVAGSERLSRAELGALLCGELGGARQQLLHARAAETSMPEHRPRDLSLRVERFTQLYGRPPGRTARLMVKDVARAVRLGAPL